MHDRTAASALTPLSGWVAPSVRRRHSIARIARLCYNAHVDTTIRNLDETVYRELKARAAVEGKTIGEAMNAAIRAYLATPDPRRQRRSDGTVELSDETRAHLSELAADRGESGLSDLVREAVEFYLKHRAEEETRIAEALSALGSLNDAEAERLRDSVRRLRATWR